MAEFEGNPEFCKLLAGRCEVDLVQFMLELAADAYPDLDRVGCLMEIDRLGVACGDRRATRGTCCVRETLTAISQLLYEVEGFHGNLDAYYEPQNSYLNEVLARRCGIPISLGILYMAVAARTGLKMFGVNTPGHFMVGCRQGNDLLFVDPFSNGDVLDRKACQCRIETKLGKKGPCAKTIFARPHRSTSPPAYCAISRPPTPCKTVGPRCSAFKCGWRPCYRRFRRNAATWDWCICDWANPARPFRFSNST